MATASQPAAAFLVATNSHTPHCGTAVRPSYHHRENVLFASAVECHQPGFSVANTLRATMRAVGPFRRCRWEWENVHTNTHSNGAELVLDANALCGRVRICRRSTPFCAVDLLTIYVHCGHTRARNQRCVRVVFVLSPCSEASTRMLRRLVHRQRA